MNISELDARLRVHNKLGRTEIQTLATELALDLAMPATWLTLWGLVRWS